MPELPEVHTTVEGLKKNHKNSVVGLLCGDGARRKTNDKKQKIF